MQLRYIVILMLFGLPLFAQEEAEACLCDLVPIVAVDDELCICSGNGCINLAENDTPNNMVIVEINGLGVMPNMNLGGVALSITSNIICIVGEPTESFIISVTMTDGQYTQLSELRICSCGDEDGSGPTPFGCDDILAGIVDPCTLEANDPLLLIDCDGDGVSNGEECEEGTDPTDPTDIPGCDDILSGEVDVCDLPDGDPLLALDCDGDGVSNGVECDEGTDPTDPTDIPGCDDILSGDVDVCDLPDGDPLLALDCDGDGYTNEEECDEGTDPTDPEDNPGDCDDVIAGTIDPCDLPDDSPLLAEDCDGDGFTNEEECDLGTDPTDPTDFPDCTDVINGTIDPCDLELGDPLLAEDCDGDGYTNDEECDEGTDPADPEDNPGDCDDVIAGTIDPCDLPDDSPLLAEDCDGDGFTNETECELDTDPTDPTDFPDCTDILDGSIDPCDLEDGDPLLELDCDMDGYTNGEECDEGTDPTDPEDNPGDCDDVIAGTIDPCDLPDDSPLLVEDCDGDGQSNQLECENGTDPDDPCDNTLSESELCDAVLADPNGDLAMADCDNDGNTNIVECDCNVMVSISGSAEGCADQGEASASGSGGSSPYSYLWNNGSTMPDLTGLASGNYVVTVTDNVGCTAVADILVNSDEDFSIQLECANGN